MWMFRKPPYSVHLPILMEKEVLLKEFRTNTYHILNAERISDRGKDE